MKIIGQCPTCMRPILLEINTSAYQYGSCMSGHAWRRQAGHDLFHAVEEKPVEESKQTRLSWDEHEPVIPEQPDAFKWCYERV